LGIDRRQVSSPDLFFLVLNAAVSYGCPVVILGGSNIGDGNNTGSLILIRYTAEEGIMKRRRKRQAVFDYDF
jgi:hypothetical protein